MIRVKYCSLYLQMFPLYPTPMGFLMNRSKPADLTIERLGYYIEAYEYQHSLDVAKSLMVNAIFAGFYYRINIVSNEVYMNVANST